MLYNLYQAPECQINKISETSSLTKIDHISSNNCGPILCQWYLLLTLCQEMTTQQLLYNDGKSVQLLQARCYEGTPTTGVNRIRQSDQYVIQQKLTPVIIIWLSDEC